MEIACLLCHDRSNSQILSKGVEHCSESCVLNLLPVYTRETFDLAVLHVEQHILIQGASSIMENLARLLQGIGYHTVLVRPLLPTFVLMIFSAVVPIYTGAHASLTRPSSAAKPSKPSKSSDSNGDDDEDELAMPKMESLSPMDAIILPVFAGLSLAGMYLLIQWLEDPALLSKILYWYISTFSVIALAKLLSDAMTVMHDFVFPDLYRSGAQMWEIRPKERVVVSTSSPGIQRDSPLPGILSLLPLPHVIKQGLWALRELPTHKFHIRAYVYNFLSASIKIGPEAIACTVLALTLQLYGILVQSPWYLNNLSGFALIYSTLQLITPSTSWTASLILSALFMYDIYFVFYTPMMVEVAMNLDIPAKMLFPRPGGMSLLGLGDIVVPGIVMGFALRFDLWLFYFKQATHEPIVEDNGRKTRSSTANDTEGESEATNRLETSKVTRPTYRTATGHWGTRFWAAGSECSSELASRGTSFPKPYFWATMIGYIIGMLCTLFVMQVFDHAQPALLYLVPGVLGALWGTALVRGEVDVLWGYSEDSVDSDKRDQKKENAEPKKNENTSMGSIKSWWRSALGHAQDFEGKKGQNKAANGAAADSKVSTASAKGTSKSAVSKTSTPGKWYKDQLIHFSISLPNTSASKPASTRQSEQFNDTAVETDTNHQDSTKW